MSKNMFIDCYKGPITIHFVQHFVFLVHKIVINKQKILANIHNAQFILCSYSQNWIIWLLVDADVKIVFATEK